VPIARSHAPFIQSIFNIHLFMKHLFLTASLFAIAARSGAAVLTTLPTPMNQGGMIHINVAFNELTSALTAAPEAGTPAIKPLSAWKPGDTFAPSSPWYATLDPTQGAGFFNSQFGLVLFDSDPLPSGSQIMVGLVSETPGLEVFQWKNTSPQNFTGILGTGGSATSWNWGSVAHGMTHPMFVMPAGSSGSASATLSFTLADGTGLALPGYTATQATLNFTVVPEPSALLLSSLAGLLVLRRRRSHSILS
jgi:hypothetical protein